MSRTIHRQETKPKAHTPSGLGLLLPGGSCRCAFQVGALTAFKERGIQFDSVVGVSSGAWNAAAYVLDEVDRLPELWLRVLSESMFCRTFQQWRVNLSPWNFRWMHLKVSKHLIDWHEIKHASTELLIGLTTFPGFRFKLFSSREHPEADFFKVALASNTLMPFYTYPTRVGTGLYLDGGFTDNAPVAPLIARGCSRVIAVSMQPQARLHHQPVRPWGYEYPHEKLSIIYPRSPLPLDFNDFSPDKIKQTIALGYEAAMKAEI